MNRKISIVGIGMDGIKTLTRQAYEAISNAQILIGAKRMLEPFKDLEKPSIAEYRSSSIAEYIENSDYSIIAVLMSGDCGFYSGAESLAKLLSMYETETICGISSPIYFCSKIGILWSGMHFVSLHGKKSSVALNVKQHEKTFFLLGGKIDVSALCSILCEYNLGEVNVFVGENLAMKNENIFCAKASQLTEISTSELCVAVVVNSCYDKCVRTGISDSEFIRSKVPMTKSEIRSAIISKLEVSSDDICWDIGCGTGSVSVEMAMQCPDGGVYSVDRNSEAVQLTQSNSRKFSCDNIYAFHAEALDAISNFPVPDRVFIGGSGGKLEKIINEVYNKNSRATIVITAVSIETLSSCLDVFNNAGTNLEIIQIAVTKTRKVGEHTMLCAENPVYVIKSEPKE